MKILVILSMLLTSVVTQAQTENARFTEAFKKGEIVNIIWQKELAELPLSSPNGIVILTIQENNADAKAVLEKMAIVAKHFAGKYLIASADFETVTKRKSGLAAVLSAFDDNENLHVIVYTREGAGVQILTNESSASDIETGLLNAFTSKPSSESSDSVSSGQVTKSDTLKKHNFKEVFRVKTDADLNALLAESKDIPVVIDFSGEGWCGPCMSFHPTFEGAAAKFNGKVRFVLVDVQYGGLTPPSAEGLKKTGYVPEIQVFTNGKKSGKQINRSSSVDGFVKIISAATGVNP